MFSKKELKPFPIIDPIELRATDGRTIMMISDNGLTSAQEVAAEKGHLILFASDSEQDIEIYALTSSLS